MNKVNNENEVMICAHGKSITNANWVFFKKNYGEIPSCGCVKCHACDKMVDPDNDVECKEVLCVEAGWITLCKDCPVYELCIYCNDYIHPDNVIKVGEDYQCKPMGVEPQQECMRRVLCYKCDKFVHPDTAMVVGEVTGRHAHRCKNRCYY